MAQGQQQRPLDYLLDTPVQRPDKLNVFENNEPESYVAFCHPSAYRMAWLVALNVPKCWNFQRGQKEIAHIRSSTRNTLEGTELSLTALI